MPTSRGTKTDTEVLVVGAGPTGLTLAASLTQRGVRVRLIDRGAGPTDQSRALGVQAGTLEALEQEFGRPLVAAMIARGFPARDAYIHLDQRPPVTVRMESIPSEHAYILMLEQSETERFLVENAERLGVRIERRTELVAIEALGAESPNDSHRYELRGPAGESETATARFIVGCDGAHSTVRRQMNIPFQGGTYDGDFILGDVAVEWPWEYGSIRTFLSPAGAMACFPMRGNRRYRFILIPKNAGAARSAEVAPDLNIAAEAFAKIAQSLAPSPIRVYDPTWLTRFRVHHRMTDRFRIGNVVLAGDAAHIHSPAGGQGMNTGIQDALNLSEKIARHSRAEEVMKTEGDLLAIYERERKRVAHRILRGTDLAFRFALRSEGMLTRVGRRWVIPALLRSKWFERRAVLALSEVVTARREMDDRRSRSVTPAP